MLTVKVVSEYALYNGQLEPQQITRTSIFEAKEVNAHHDMSQTTIIFDDSVTALAVPQFYGADDWKAPCKEGQPTPQVITAVYVENEKGKTIHAIKAMMK